MSGSAELHVAAGPIEGAEFTFAKGCGFVTVHGTFAINGAAKFVPCCDQYTGGGIVTTADRFTLAAEASVEAVSLGYAWFADRVTLAGKIDVTTEAVRTAGAPSGGGIWITATTRLNVRPTTQLLAKGGNSAQKFGNGNGGGGRIAFGVWLTEEEVLMLAATGELPSGSKTVVGGEEEFLADYPGTTISIEGGQAANEPDEPLEVCCGSFRFLVGSKKSHTVILLR